MPMEKYWPHSRVLGELPSAVSSSKASDGAQVSRSGALFRTFDQFLNAHGPDPPFSTFPPLPAPTVQSLLSQLAAGLMGSWGPVRPQAVCRGILSSAWNLEERWILQGVTGDVHRSGVPHASPNSFRPRVWENMRTRPGG